MKIGTADAHAVFSTCRLSFVSGSAKLIFILKISGKFFIARARDSRRGAEREPRASFHPPNRVAHKGLFVRARGSLSAFSPGGVESHKIASLSVSSAQSPCPERVRSPLLTLSLLALGYF